MIYCTLKINYKIVHENINDDTIGTIRVKRDFIWKNKLKKIYNKI